MKKLFMFIILISSLSFGNNEQIKDLSLKPNGKIKPYEDYLIRQKLISELPIKIKYDNKTMYIRFKDIKNIRIYEDYIECSILNYGVYCEIDLIRIKDKETQDIIVSLFKKQQEEIISVLK